MKIFSSFDTEFKKEIFNKEVEKYWKDKVYLISHWRVYYWLYILIPFVLLLISWIGYYVLLYVLFSDSSEEWVNIWKIIWYTLSIFIFMPFALKLLKKYIDFYMDFIVVTPKTLISYNQEWFFSRMWRTIDVEKIKSISVSKDGFWRSLFNYWSIIILTEWDEKWAGEINFSFIDDPDNVKFKVMEIIESEKE